MVLGLVSIYLDISEVESVSHIAQINSNLLYSFNMMTNGYSKKSDKEKQMRKKSE